MKSRYPWLSLVSFCFSAGFVALPASLSAHGAAPTSDVQPTESLLERAYGLDAGKSAPRDAAGAAALYRQAAEVGDAFAHLRLGYLCETGDGVPQDYLAARQHYQIAADSGLKEAHLRLAICHLEGWGGPVDRDAFAREMRNAADAGDVPAQRIMASMYMVGIGVPKDQAEALRWMERAAAAKDPIAEKNLGDRALAARRKNLMPDDTLARNWYQLSAEREYLSGMRAMARTFLLGSRADRNWELGKHWLELASDDGDAEAPYTLAVCEMLHVDSPTHDETRAESLLKLASSRGNERATEVLQLKVGGKSLTEAFKYILSVPFEDRYVQRAASKESGGPDQPPRVYRIVKPVYPMTLRLSETEGEVRVDFVVDTTGRVLNAKAVKSTHPLFSERAVKAVEQWRFYPGRKAGRLVKTHMQVPVYFQLTDEQIAGVDGFLQFARARAAELGGAVAADATDLRVASPKQRPAMPVGADGAPLTTGHAVILVALDAAGHPLRAHVLQAEPASIGEQVRAIALRTEFTPRVIDGVATPSNVVLGFNAAAAQEQVFK